MAAKTPSAYSRNNLPKGWRWAQLSEIASSGATRNPAKDGSSSFRYVDIEALDNTRQSIASAPILPTKDAPSRARMLIRSGDVIFSLVRPYLKNIAIVPSDLDGQIASTAYCVLHPVDGVDSRFLFHYLCQDAFINSVPTYGNSPPSARDDEFVTLRVPVAPSREQRRIVAKIEELFSDLDAGVAALERVKANLKRYRASVLKAAVEGRLTKDWRKKHPDAEPASKLLQRILVERREKWEEEQLRKFKAAGKTPPKNWKDKYQEPAGPDTSGLPELPEGWCWATVEQLALLVTDGDHNPPIRINQGIPHLTAKHVKNGRLILASCTYISKEDFERTKKRYEPITGDIVITCVGTVGSVAVVPEGVVFSADRNLAAIRLVPEGLRAEYLSRVLGSPDWQKRMLEASGATAQPHLYLNDIRVITVPIPPNREQSEIVSEVDRRLSVADAVAAEVEHSLRRAGRLRQAILKRTFEGRLVPQDPKDEPAERMLERIKGIAQEGATPAARRHPKRANPLPMQGSP